VTRIVAILAAMALLALGAGPALAATPKPKLGRTIVVKATDGSVLVKPRKGKQRKLRKNKPIALAVGSTVDATKGKVKLTSARKHTGTQSGVFSQGAFVVTQRKSDSLTDLTLTGGKTVVCAASGANTKPVVAAAKKKRRRLFGRAHGRFRTRGRNSSATVRGTDWLTEDRCEGTVTQNKSKNKTSQIETTGEGALAFELEPGQTITYYCNKLNLEPDMYCLVLLAQPADGLIGTGILTRANQPDYALCVRWPDQSEHCFKFGLSEADDQGFRSSVIACPVGAPGRYDVAWSLDYANLNFLYPNPLSLTLDVAGPAVECLHQP
jgi:hypothetical protein